MTPSIKDVMDDAAEISLENGEASSDIASDNSDHPKVPGVVVVTTTIKRESRPGHLAFAELAIEEGYSPQSQMGPVSGAVGLRGDSYLGTSQTKITAGRPH